MAIELKKALVLSSVGASFNRGDFTNGNAFFWSSVDLSFYLKHFIELIDGAGKKAAGYIGAVGAGEALGSELITVWTNDDYNTFISSGKDISSAIANGPLTNGAYTIQILPTQDGLYLLSLILTLNSGTTPKVYEGHTWKVYDGGLGLTILVAGSNNLYFTSTDLAIYTIITNSAVGDWSSINTLKRVTDPPSTAVHIVSSLNGTTRNWASIESGFNPNNIASFKIYKYPNIKNKFSKFSITKILSLFDKYKVFQPSALWNARSLLISPSDSIWNYLIGWYWNAEGSGNIVYNMAPGNGLAGGGLLPNLEVTNSGEYWSISDFAFSPHSGVAYSKAKFLQRMISEYAAVGIFFNRLETWTNSLYGWQLKFWDTILFNEIFLNNSSQIPNYYFHYIWDTEGFEPSNNINEWYLLFNDDTDIPKVAKSDGTLLSFSAGQIITPFDTLVDTLFLGNNDNPIVGGHGAGGLLGDVLIFNNIRLTLEQWGLIYDLCASRYGMAARTW